MIGLAAAGLFHFTGKILGVSNITSELMNRNHQHKAWRLIFIAGILAGGILLLWLNSATINQESPRTILTLIFAGLLVGYGSSLGRGCTSGHGICGITRLSGRAVVAVLIFIATGILTVFVSNHIFPGQL
jgi:uncharacterized membrane protein YedE/YeeE